MKELLFRAKILVEKRVSPLRFDRSDEYLIQAVKFSGLLIAVEIDAVEMLGRVW
jgi:hypothetical protein